MKKYLPFYCSLLFSLFVAVSCKKEQPELQGRWRQDKTLIINYELPFNRKASEFNQPLGGVGDVRTLDIGERNWDWGTTLAQTGATSQIKCTYTRKGDNIRVEGHTNPTALPDYKIRSLSDRQLVLVQEVTLTQQNTRTEYELTFSRAR